MARNTIMLTMLLAAGGVLAQTAGQPDQQPDQQPEERPEPSKPLPSLDDLLGLTEPEDEQQTTDDAGEIEFEVEASGDLVRQLTGEEAGDKLVEAQKLMEDVSRRIGGGRPDLGLSTQRIQEDILRKLDEAIDSIGQGGGGGGSSSSQAQGNQQPQSQPDQKGNSGASPQGQGNQDNNGEVSAPGLSGVEQNPEIEATAARWGALPERLRGALLQGLSERYSETYRNLTEAYYRRLAEEAETNR